jgi:hypothetical protein
MLKKNILLFFFLVSFVTISFGQGKQISNEKYKFTFTYPTDVLPTKIGEAILEFRGTKKKYGEDALFFLKRIMPLKISPIERLESFMKETATIEGFDKDFVGSMKTSFPDIISLDKSFIYFNDKPVIQGTYSFVREGTSMKGRYMLVLVKEQSSIYVFSWTSKMSMYESWNKASEKTVKSLKTTQ